MKKKRLGAISLLFVLALSLGACDELDDILSSTTGGDNTGDESEDIGGSGQNPSDDEEDEGNNPVNKDVVITLSATSISIKENETEYFSVTLSDSDASVLSVDPVDGTCIEVGLTSNTSEYYVTGLEAGSTSVIVTAGGEDFNTATASINVTVEADSSSEDQGGSGGSGEGGDPEEGHDDPTEPKEEVTTYELSITNKSELGSEWKVTSGEHTLAVSLITIIAVDDVEQERETESANTGDVSLIVSDSEGNECNAVTTSGLTLYPASTGSVVITAYWNDHPEAYDTYSVLITEDKEYSYSLTIDNKDCLSFTGEDENVWKVGEEGKSLVVSLVTTEHTYTAPTNPTENTTSITADATQVNVSAVNIDPSDESEVINVNGLLLTPVGAGTAVITVSWKDHPEATDSFTVTITEADDVTYSLSITNSYDLQQKWYIDGEARQLEIAITPSDGSIVEVTSLIQNNEISVTPVTGGIVEVSIDTSSGVITLSPLNEGSTTINASWTGHPEATASIAITISLHSYEIAISNADELITEWYLEDEPTRTVSVSLSKDSISVETSSLSEGYVSLVAGGEDKEAISISEFTVTAKAGGAPTITAVWYDSSDSVLAESEPITLNINDYVKVTGISLDQNELNLEYGGTGTITATLTGQNDKTPTNTEVSWSSSDSAVIVTPDSTDSRVATVTGNKEATGVTITATALGDTSKTATCTVSVAAKELTAFKVIDGSAKPTVVDTPDDNGVYVIADSSATSYIGYSSGFSIVSTYDAAIGVRTIPTETTGSYILEINGQYLSSSLSLVSSIDEAETFAVTSSGITGLYVTASGLASSGEVPAHLIDYTYYEHEDTTTGGEYYLYGVYKDYDYNSYMTGAVASNKLSTTDLLLEAAKVTVTQENDAIYMTSGGKYLSVNGGSDSNVTFNTTKAPTYYDSTNDVWQSSNGGSDDARYLGTNLGSSLVVFGSYKYSSGKLDSSYTGVYLYHMDQLPIEKGISLSATEYELEEDSSTATQIKYYPSCDTDFEPSDISWSQSSENGGEVSINESNGVILATSAGTVVVTATLGHTPSLSHSITLDISANESGYKTLTYSYTFKSGDLGSSTSSGTSSSLGGLVWDYSECTSKNYDSSRGIQIGKGSSGYGQTSSPFTITATISEEVTLTSIKLGMCAASGGGGTYTVYFGSSAESLSEVATDSIGVNTSGPNYYTHDDLEAVGTTIQIAMLSTKDKALYLASVEFTVLVPSDSSLSF